MEYFLKYNEFKLLKNYILKDPICDWFEIQEYRGDNSYQKDKSSYYKDYIVKESQKYKENVLQEIRSLSKLSIPLETNINDTKEKLINNYPLILQGKLLDQRGLYVHCDIIIHYQLFSKKSLIFPHRTHFVFLVCLCL